MALHTSNSWKISSKSPTIDNCVALLTIVQQNNLTPLLLVKSVPWELHYPSPFLEVGLLLWISYLLSNCSWQSFWSDVIDQNCKKSACLPVTSTQFKMSVRFCTIQSATKIVLYSGDCANVKHRISHSKCTAKPNLLSGLSPRLCAVWVFTIFRYEKTTFAIFLISLRTYHLLKWIVFQWRLHHNLSLGFANSRPRGQQHCSDHSSQVEGYSINNLIFRAKDRFDNTRNIIWNFDHQRGNSTIAKKIFPMHSQISRV